MELWLARHGTTRANLEKCFQGQRNTALSVQGRWESIRLARRLNSQPPGWFFSSDLKRAWETASIISREINIKARPMPLLRECSWGTIEGLTRATVVARYTRLGLHQLPAGIPGAERKRRLMVRARNAFATLLATVGLRGRVLLVSHGRFINAFISTCLGLKARDPWPFSPAPASCTVLEYRPEERLFKLRFFNDCHHLS
ncbi:MAG: histidine phosphatase family protein [Firmicutes bacterium]|nr:histidine phosphatase family protein [Bacillota bacterium]